MKKSCIIVKLEKEDVNKSLSFSPTKLGLPLIASKRHRRKEVHTNNYIGIYCYSDAVEDFIKKWLDTYKAALNFCLGGDVKGIYDDGIEYLIDNGTHWSHCMPLSMSGIYFLNEYFEASDYYMFNNGKWLKYDCDDDWWNEL